MIEAGAAIGAMGLALLIIGPSRPLRLAGLAGWAAGWAVLLVGLEPEGGLPAAGIAAGAALVLAPLFLRWPWLLPLAVLGGTLARFPLDVGPDELELPLALYLVAEGAALALAWQLFWEIPRAADTSGSRVRRLLAGARHDLGPVALPLALLVAWLGLGCLWSSDARPGGTLLGLAVLPFGLVAVAAARLPRRDGWAATLYVGLTLVGLALAGAGGFEYLRRDVVVDPGRGEADETLLPSSWYHPVGPVLDDPSAYGRLLAVATLASVAVVVLGGRRAGALALAAAALTWLGLVPSFSQSSLVALAAGLVVALAARARPRGVVAAAALAVLALAAAGLAVPEARDRVLGDPGLAAADRPSLVDETIRLALDRPAGAGTGAVAEALAERTGDPEAAPPESAPLVVAGENGLAGLALLAWVAAAALASVLWAALPRDGTGVLRLAVGLALLAILVQSIYADTLFEDPLFWALLGLAAAAGRAR